MRKDNGGFSLIEMIIVIAIAAILTGSSFTMVRSIAYANTKKASETVLSTLDTQRITAMSKKGNWYVYIYHLSDGCYIKAVDNVELSSFNASYLDNKGIKICSDSIGIYIDSEAGTKVDGTDIICIKYTKTGVFDGTKTNVNKIIVDGTGTNTITLVHSTGKSYLE